MKWCVKLWAPSECSHYIKKKYRGRTKRHQNGVEMSSKWLFGYGSLWRYRELLFCLGNCDKSYHDWSELSSRLYIIKPKLDYPRASSCFYCSLNFSHLLSARISSSCDVISKVRWRVAMRWWIALLSPTTFFIIMLVIRISRFINSHFRALYTRNINETRDFTAILRGDRTTVKRHR